MAIHPLAGQKAPPELLVDVDKLNNAYFENAPDLAEPTQRVAFGTSGHRGSSFQNTFNEAHILAICQALSEYRHAQKISGPLFIGIDTHALSQPAFETAVEVFAANDVAVHVQEGGGFTPTPVISHAILTYNRLVKEGFADGVVITPSHNPPEDGGFKYNPPHGGPAGSDVTKIIEDRANEIMATGAKINRTPFTTAIKQAKEHDYMESYINDLENVLDMKAIKGAGLKIGVDPMGGAGIAYWDPIAERYGLNIEVVNKNVDPQFSFMPVDHDGKIRMDCSSPYAMTNLVSLCDKFDIAFGNDPDYDRHGIVVKKGGVMNPNHFLAVAVEHLFETRDQWGADVMVGKTVVSSSMTDRVTEWMKKSLYEVPVGFKWFVDPMLSGKLGFGGEESSGASFLRKDGTCWSTDKDGIIMDLLAAEILAVTGRDPADYYREQETRFGQAFYERIDAVANREQKEVLKSLSPESVKATELADDHITAKLTHAPGNGASIGGLKVVTNRGWFAARPSGTEDIYKIYAESFFSRTHLRAIQREAKKIVSTAFENSGV